MIVRIDQARPLISSVTEDSRVLDYIRNELTPARLAQRKAADPEDSVDHLRQVAATRLKPYEKQQEVQA